MPSGILHSSGSNKPNIEHSKSAIFVLLYSLHLHTKPCQGYEDRNETFINEEMPP